MGKATVRTIVVSRKVTIFLLLLTTIGIILLTLYASGKAYTKVDPVPFRDVRILAERLAEGPVPMRTVVALTMPTILNMLIFMPWGFFMFLALDNVNRPTSQSYLLTFLFAIGFSAAIEAWQYFLPTRVTDINDIISNGVGSVVGAFLGHLRKRVRVTFE
jgi:glycopeptide antibiotics resistance protein